MANIGWGKPSLFVKSRTIANALWRQLANPVEDTTSYETSKGDKLEAKVEGGKYEDVKYKENTGTLTFDIRVAKGRKKPFQDHDGVIDGEWEFALQPEDAAVPAGLYIKRAVISSEVKFASADGTTYTYTVEPLAPEAGGDALAVGTVTVSKDEQTSKITGITCTELEGESEEVAG